MARDSILDQTKKDFEERVLQIKRVSKKTKGGNKIGFTALVVLGDKKGKVGSGLGKATDVRSAIRKGVAAAKKDIIKVNLRGPTIPHDISAKFVKSHIFMKPAPKGSGIIAGGVIRHVVELVGISDISAKMLGSSNKNTNVKCAIMALGKLKKIESGESDESVEPAEPKDSPEKPAKKAKIDKKTSKVKQTEKVKEDKK